MSTKPVFMLQRCLSVYTYTTLTVLHCPLGAAYRMRNHKLWECPPYRLTSNVSIHHPYDWRDAALPMSKTQIIPHTQPTK